MTIVQRNETTMGYPFQITVKSSFSKFNINPVVRLACHTIDLLELLFDIENPNSTINMYNRGEVKSEHTPHIFQEVLSECLYWQKITGGVFAPFSQSSTPIGSNELNIFNPNGILKSYSMKLLGETLSGFGLPDYTIKVWDDIYIGNQHSNPEDRIIDFSQSLTLNNNKSNIMRLNFNNTHMHAMAKSNLHDNGGDIWLGAGNLPIVGDFIETTIIAKNPVTADFWSIVALNEGYKSLEHIKSFNTHMIQNGHPEETIEGMFTTGDYDYIFTENFKTYIV